jgi:hypothetical protein
MKLQVPFRMPAMDRHIIAHQPLAQHLTAGVAAQDPRLRTAAGRPWIPLGARAPPVFRQQRLVGR